MLVLCDGESKVGESCSVVDHLNEIGFIELLRFERWRVYLYYHLSDVIRQFGFYVDQITEERPLS